MDILIAQETELHQYETRQNRDAIERLLHADFAEVGMSGTSYTFESIVSMMSEELPTHLRVHAQNYSCDKLAPDVYLLRYQCALVGQHGEACEFAKRCSIWVLAQGRWQLKYHQGTACAPFVLV
ncbi:DUF4440 domain-containing protein [Pseudoalteromonas ardens]|uniref:DUF4440 domain-containing protein n=1 Tax=Pseudoalteromonas rubra TaxID=43658 RepID=A0A0L0ENN2_9GAMM|nr:DUF4440 domain-containing protein [Pseudoalteromonas sp. R96]KNC65508.1 hypothetical protein AC626_22700 [Pseudoalteromonas rubra]MDK1310339.1 DUF4440 domain-containing protein [Pseudoalteromonas sp. R96]